ncbi:MAG: hypothetical protein MUF04_12985 [Akkermansiaceae bacterium]|nr:hypothetical protein [Akkermansiaceae bacterium]
MPLASRAGPPYSPPHGHFDIPDSGPAWKTYQDKPWPEPAYRCAAMVGMPDRQAGEILTLLKFPLVTSWAAERQWEA